MTTSTLHKAYLTEYLRRAAATAERAWPEMIARVTGDRSRWRDPLDTGDGIPLIATLARYPHGTAEDDVLAGVAIPEYVELTGDGRYARWQEWHTGPGSWSDSVYYERWRDGVRIGHGWLDAESRKLVQSG